MSQDDATTRLLSGNEALPLDPAEAGWVLVSGEAAVFALDAAGARWLLKDVASGEVVLGLPPLEGFRFVLVPVGPARLAPYEGRELLRACVRSAQAKGLLAAWVGGLSEAAAVPPLGAEGLLTPLQPLGPQLRALQGDVGSAGAPEAQLDVNPDLAWEELQAHHRAVCAKVVERLRIEAEARGQRLGERMASERRDLEGSVASLAEVVTGSRAAGLHHEDPLMAAVALVGQAVGFEVKPPAKSEDMSRVREPVEAVARASRVRTRQVLLNQGWWLYDHGHLLAYLREGHAPVALLREASGYRLVNPTSPEPQWVDEALANQLEPFGVTFYRSLPDGMLNARTLLSFAVKPQWRELIWVGALGIAVSLLGMVVPQATGLLVDRAIPDSDRMLLLQLALALLMATFGRVVFQTCQGLVLSRVEARSDADTQAGVWDRVLNLGAPFFRRYPVGDLFGRIMTVGQIRQRLSGNTMRTMFSSVFALLNLALMFFYSAPMAAAAFVVTLLSLLIDSVLTVRRLRAAQPLRVLEGELQGLTVQLVQGVSKLQVAGAEGRAFSRWAGKYRQRAAIHASLARYDNALGVINEMVQPLGTMLIFYLAVAAMQVGAQGTTGALATGTFLAFFSAYATFQGGAHDLASVAIEQLDIAVLWQRAKPVLEELPEIHEGQTDPGRLRGRVALDRITFRYDPDSKPILDDVSIVAEPGEHIALVGPSGCGKSTIFRLLLGFEAPESGIVSYDQQDLKTLDPRAVRRQMGTVLQMGKLNAGSLMDNVSAGANLTQDEVWEALAGAGMADDVRGMAMGLHTVISEGGTNLSGGQRQRLLIARALALKPKVMLFDEATSALDNLTQGTVSATLEKMKATRIVIAHRLSTIRDADRIYVLDQGKVVEVGSFEELARGNGLFSRLVARQAI